MHDEIKNASVDVFDFLIQEKSRSKELVAADKDDAIGNANDSPNDGDREEPDSGTEPDREITLHLDTSEPEGYYRSMSDSGISMGSNNSTTSGHGRKGHLPVLVEEPTFRPFPEHRLGNELALIDPRWGWSTASPRSWPEGYIPPPCPPPPPAVTYDVPIYPYPPDTPDRTPPPLSEEAIPGPIITIREPAGQPIKSKCFRSFHRLSTRLLLHMQAEIADLDQELDALDEETDAAEKSDDRSSAHSRENRDRKHHEDEIYRELHVKLDNYYHALEMMHKVDSISQPAVKSDLTKYHSWLEARIRQTARIRQLVGADLRRFTGSTSDKNQTLQTFQPQYLAYCCLVNAAIPLVMFKVVKGVLNRLILLALVVVAGSLAQDRLWKTVGRDELTCILVCICISAFAAVLL